MSRILFVGDLQIGAGAHFGTPERSRLADQAEAWSWIVDQAYDKWDCDRIVLLGDVFHRRLPSPDELIAFHTPLTRAHEAGIEVLAIAGNHDISAETAASALEIFSDQLTFHRTPAVWGKIATLPWTPPHRLAAAHGRDRINERVAVHLVECARDLHVGSLYGRAPMLLALHWSISGGVTSSGVETISLAEPILPLDDLLGLGYRWIVAGHIHKPQIPAGAGDNASTTVIVAGSPIIADFGEADHEHYVWIIDTDADTYEWKVVPQRRFLTVTDLNEWTRDDLDDLEDAVVRVRYTAAPEEAAALDHAEVERALYDAGAHKVYEIVNEWRGERRARAEHVDETLDPLEAVDAWTVAQGDAVSTESAVALAAYTAKKLDEL
jgi:DNA repair exonuclease SbcCD nuclease subunit